jgi:undecaprenyl-phosphate 4-deoxy-4-formamido-L-arabinose transferase
MVDTDDSALALHLSKTCSVSAVVPVFRSAETLEPLCRRLAAALKTLVGGRYEIILVEDGGGDGSWAEIERLAGLDERVRGFRLSRNYGQHNALLCGIRAAHGEVIVTIDDDLQNPPEEVGKLLAELAQGHDVVYGYAADQAHGLWRGLASRVTKRVLQRAMGVASASKVGAFRAFRTDLRHAFADYRSPAVNIDVLLTWATTRFGAVEVRHAARAAGVSGYGPGKLIAHAINMVTGFSTLPLQVASLLGIGASLFGFAIFAYVLLNYFIAGAPVPGFAFLASIIAIFSGVQLFTLGVFGEYLARMHFRVMDRPAYVLSDETEAPPDSGAFGS